MAKILSVDAAGKGLSLAVVEGDRLIASCCLNVGLTHSERLLPMLQALLGGAGLTLADMDLVAVTNGPGSFTGLRIGLATAKGLAEGQGLPLLPVGTLEAEAYAVRQMGAFICPVLDARRNEVYTALYAPDGAEIWPPMALSLSDLAERLREFLAASADIKQVIFVGDAAEIYINQMRAELGEACRIAPPEKRLFGAFGAAFIAQERTEEALPPERVEAFYLRLSEAERNRIAKLKAEEKA
ncbi:MAG: tRNA (adenosine(37)-N6)-threonylcarbamoyltransferase complex dimerization subunit type 1 TsaB [Firmicutes bacterium]|nr:tRNA (adenosine(37)-N6)-threonylcarbamoyltransferase complex dimerization subunit type 1 TsaB [Bacillota bacterium]